MLKFTLFFFFGFALGLVILKNSFSSDEAMEQCQKTNSYDVCFQQLNR